MNMSEEMETGKEIPNNDRVLWYEHLQVTISYYVDCK